MDEHSDYSNEQEHVPRPPNTFRIFTPQTMMDIVNGQPPQVKVPSFLGGNCIRENLMHSEPFVYLSADKHNLDFLENLSAETMHANFSSLMTPLSQFLGDVDIESDLCFRIYGVNLKEIRRVTPENRKLMGEKLLEATRGIFDKFSKLNGIVRVYKRRFQIDPVGVEDLYLLYRKFFWFASAVYGFVGCDTACDPIFFPLPYNIHDEFLSNQDGQSDLVDLKLYLRQEAKKKKLRRVKNEILRPIFVNGFFTYAYERFATTSEWARTMVGTPSMGMKYMSLYEGHPSWPGDIEKYLSERDGLEELRYSRYLFSFRNGVYDIVLNRFVEHRNMSPKFLPAPDVVACQYFDLDFHPGDLGRDVELPFPEPPPSWGVDDRPVASETVHDIPTPAFDKILHDQKMRYCLRIAFYVLMGRLFFDTEYLDGLEAVVFILGRKETGKSTFCKFFEHIYPSFMRGTFADKGEEVFGMESFLSKVFVSNSEVGPEWTIPKTTFLKIVSGDSLSVAKKYGSAVTINWRASALFAGNDYMKFNDDTHALARRFFFFFFRYAVQRDGSMLQQLVAETPRIMAKCISYYHAFIRAYPINSVCPWPKEFSDAKRTYLASQSSIYAFLSDPVRFVCEPGKYIPISKITALYKNHMRNIGRGREIPKSVNSDTWMLAVEAFGNPLVSVGRENELKHYPIGSESVVHDVYIHGIDALMQ